MLRRGPTNLVHVFSWNREDDTFTEGPWFKGKIYADRSDLSPDGRFLLYFAMGGLKSAIPMTGGTWTAISRPPSLTAIALWGQGDTWGGGGMFTSKSSFWLDADANTFLIRDEGMLSRDFKRPPLSRMERDGWISIDSRSRKGIFEKSIGNGWTLRRTSRPDKADRHELERCESGLRFALPTWEWADWDRKRLVWTEAGILNAATLGPDGLGPIHTLHDFTNS